MSEPEKLRLTCVTAHPDDESLGFGGTLARYAAEGADVSLVVATRGERGRYGDGSRPHPGPEALGRIREAEVRAACEVLGVHQVRFLDYLDAEVDQVDPGEGTARIAVHLRELRPHVVLTFDPYGAYGHPDHIAISQLTTGALVRAASAEVLPGSDLEPHQVKKLYYVAWTGRVWEHYHAAFKVLRMTVDGTVRSSVAWPDWSVTTTTDAHEHWETVWAAVQCHETQMGQYGALTALGPDDHKALWGPQEYYRAFSLVNGGRVRERDVFEGLS
jgi:LmbE family N-acetylglucosaminyl deacetylase